MNGDLLGRMLTGAARMGMAGWQAQQQGQQPGQQPQSPQQLLRGLKQPASSPALSKTMGANLFAQQPGTNRPAPGTPVPAWGPENPFLRKLQGR
jgi:hypothetical protein